MQIATCHVLWWHSVWHILFWLGWHWFNVLQTFLRAILPIQQHSTHSQIVHSFRKGLQGPLSRCDDISLRLSREPPHSPSDSSLPVSQEFLAPLLSGVASLGPCPSLDVALCQRSGSGEVNFLRDWMFLSVFTLLSPLIGFLLDVQVGHHFPAALEVRTHCSLLVSCDAWSHSDSWSYCFFGGLVCLWYHKSHPLGFWMGLCSLLLSGPQGYLSLFFWDTVSLCSPGKLWTYLCFCLPALGLQVYTTTAR